MTKKLWLFCELNFSLNSKKQSRRSDSNKKIKKVWILYLSKNCLIPFLNQEKNQNMYVLITLTANFTWAIFTFIVFSNHYFGYWSFYNLDFSLSCQPKNIGYYLNDLYIKLRILHSVLRVGFRQFFWQKILACILWRVFSYVITWAIQKNPHLVLLAS